MAYYKGNQGNTPMTTTVSIKVQLSFDTDFDSITLEDVKKALAEVSAHDVKRAVYDADEEDVQVLSLIHI